MVASGPARLHVREVGEGPPVIVLHGGPDFDHEYLLPDLDRLADRLRLVYYDQRGRGRSYTGEGPGDVTIEGEMADLDRVRAWTGSSSVAVLGHSWGALLAMEYAVRRPDRVSHLILLNTVPASHAGAAAVRADYAARRSPEETARLDALASGAAFRRGDVDAEAEYYRLHFRPALPDPEQLDRVVRRLRVAFTAEGVLAAREIEASLYAQTWRRTDYDLLPLLRRRPVPTLVIQGDRDICPVHVAREVVTAMPASRLVVLPDCGHFAYLEQPDAVRAAVEAFVLGRP